MVIFKSFWFTKWWCSISEYSELLCLIFLLSLVDNSLFKYYKMFLALSNISNFWNCCLCFYYVEIYARHKIVGFFFYPYISFKEKSYIYLIPLPNCGWWEGDRESIGRVAKRHLAPDGSKPWNVDNILTIET